MPIGTVASLPSLRIATPTRLPLRPSRRRRIAAFLAGGITAAVLLALGTAVCVAALFLFVVAAPIAAGTVLWLMWRIDEGEAARRTRRLRARVRRRARALGLRVLGASR